MHLLLRCSPYPSLKAFERRETSLVLTDRNGSLIQITSCVGGVRREYTPLKEIPAEITTAFLFSEDRRFYWHIGIDPLAVMRAFLQNISGKREVSGASTITMQLARIINNAGTADASGGRNSGARTKAQRIGAKFMEAFNALRLESRFSKKQILEYYLNAVPFGFQSEGVTSAARTFYASSLDALTAPQMLCLAMIPRRPAQYNPLDNGDACVKAAARLNVELLQKKSRAKKFPRLADITEDDWQNAASSARRFAYPFKMPHFVRYVAEEIKTERKNGIFAKKSSILQRTQKTHITLSIDLSVQDALQNMISSNVERYYTSRLTNGAGIILDNATGEILAWVGSADYANNDAAGQIDGVTALNQPGSSMKPFLYALALENGFSPADILADIPMKFGDTALYIPQNFNNRFNGPILFRQALASSLNIPAVFLAYRVGADHYTKKLFELGFDSLHKSADDAGLGLALGNAPVNIKELVRAFSVFPNDGRLMPLQYRKVDGEKIDRGKIDKADGGKADKADGGKTAKPSAGSRVYTGDTARIICSFLSDRSARVLAFGAGKNFETPFPAIFKTGTANQYQSIVALGATPRYTAAVWMGNFTGETVVGKTGSSVPAAIVRDSLVLLQGNTALPFARPAQYDLQEVCALSGMAPNAFCTAVIKEFVPKNKTLPSCAWHRFENGESTLTYPAEYQAWFNATVRQGGIDYGTHALEILSPRNGFVFLGNSGSVFGNNEIPVEVIGGSSDTLTVSVDGTQKFTLDARPFVFYISAQHGEHSLIVQNGDEQDSVIFSVE
ncbi:MAG: hypothetical protein Ta2A_10140 [Treponemataceae bacterium]|nr:MAG: hypothetical protein Ta2A_10140 [Treponemataceae bacterium]